jgi:membrane associated rhomboid family serine protease
MLPLRDTVRSKSFPAANWTLIGLNILVFLYEISLSPARLSRFIDTYGLVPAHLHLNHLSLLIQNPTPLITLFTAMFIHGGWFHILSNMWVLFIFGDNVEDRLGSARYLLFYIFGGLVANLLQAFVFPTSQIPAIGASGAIASALGAYFLFYPTAKVLTLIPIFIIPWFIELPAVIFLGFWFISQLFSGLFSLGVPAGANVGGVAWWAHIGGFIFGLLFARWFAVQPQNIVRRFPDDYPPGGIGWE